MILLYSMGDDGRSGKGFWGRSPFERATGETVSSLSLEINVSVGDP